MFIFRKDLIEPILVNWLLFMCRLIDHSKTLSVFVEFVKARPGLIYFLIQSIADPMLSSVYFNTVILMFTKILEFGKILVFCLDLVVIKCIFVKLNEVNNHQTPIPSSNYPLLLSQLIKGIHSFCKCLQKLAIILLITCSFKYFFPVSIFSGTKTRSSRFWVSAFRLNCRFCV